MPDDLEHATEALAAHAGRVAFSLGDLEPIERKTAADDLRTIGLELVRWAGVASETAMMDARRAWGVEEAAARLGVSGYYLKRKTTLEPGSRPPKSAASKKRAALKHYAKGWTVQRISTELRMSERTVKRTILDAGIPLRDTHIRAGKPGDLALAVATEVCEADTIG